MSRFLGRLLWVTLLVFSLLACQLQGGGSTPVTITSSKAATILSHREYAVYQRLRLVNEGPEQPEKQNLWVALIRTIQPYQEVLSLEITPKEYVLVSDEYGNRYAEFDLSEHTAGTSKVVQIDYRLVVNELAYDLSDCEGEMLAEFILPELHIESTNPQIVALASELSQGKQTACQQVRAFYDHVGDKLVYSYNANNWGAQAALGPMGADCTEYASLLVALSRAGDTGHSTCQRTWSQGSRCRLG